MTLHTLFAAFAVLLSRHTTWNLSLPSSFLPSLSLVVGLILVFRNSTTYDRFWTGRARLIGGTETFRVGGEFGAEEQQNHVALSLRATVNFIL